MPTRLPWEDDAEHRLGADADHEEPGRAEIELRKKIDAELDAAVKRGGATPQDEFFAELRARYGD